MNFQEKKCWSGFIFKRYWNYQSSPPGELTFHIHNEQLSDVIEQFEYFLKACGFHFEGHLDIISDEPINEPEITD